MNSRTEINVSYYFHRKLALIAHVEQAIVPNAGECTDVYHTDFLFSEVIFRLQNHQKSAI